MAASHLVLHRLGPLVWRPLSGFGKGASSQISYDISSSGHDFMIPLRSLDDSLPKACSQFFAACHVFASIAQASALCRHCHDSLLVGEWPGLEKPFTEHDRAIAQRTFYIILLEQREDNIASTYRQFFLLDPFGPFGARVDPQEMMSMTFHDNDRKIEFGLCAANSFLRPSRLSRHAQESQDLLSGETFSRKVRQEQDMPKSVELVNWQQGNNTKHRDSAKKSNQ